MKTQNRIDINLTQPLNETNNCVFKKKANLRAMSAKLFTVKPLKEIVQEISFADIIPSSSSTPSNVSDSSINVQLARNIKKMKTMTEIDEPLDQCLIDGKPFYINKQQIQEKVKEILNESIDKSLDTTEYISDAPTFRDWARQQREKHLRKETLVSQAEKGSESSSSAKSLTTSSKKLNRRRKRKKKIFRHLGGFMYGPFTKPEKPNELAKSNKFGITFTMINRAKQESHKRKIQDDVLRRVRLSHMGYNQPPDKEESSDSESLQNVKRLALLRTPYFMVPTIKISQVKRKDRLRNKFLKKDRLNRINLLLNERFIKSDKQSDADATDSSNQEESDDKIKVTKKHEFFAKFFQLSTKSKLALKRDPVKEKYYKLILDKFEKQKRLCEPKTEV